jgi:hypothetical protein
MQENALVHLHYGRHKNWIRLRACQGVGRRGFSRSMTRLRPSTILLFCATAISALLALAPWFRNRQYLRDLYDYGLVLAANGHMERGEYPYVDFTTPIQAGFLGLNWMVERGTGGTYGGLTLGAAGLIVLSAVLLTLMLSRRWPWGLAVLVGGAVTIASASQHTILWHNALGVFCLSVVAWSAAIAPVWRRVTWPWHLLTAFGLILGGLNKVNFQLVALAVACAWALRLGVLRLASWGVVVRSILAVILAGVVAPIALELGWTGATISLWWHNVIMLPIGQRLGILDKLLTSDFLFREMHDYYGPSLIPAVGLFGVLITVAAAAGLGWLHRHDQINRMLAPVSALAAGLAGAVILQSNYEISHLGLAAWLVLAVSVWLGAGPTIPARRWLLAAVALPALALATSAWTSAWKGQRSQFGYSPAPRTAYVPVSQLVPSLGALQGLRLPPELADSLRMSERILPMADEQGRYFVFYGLGMEWMDRFFPARREKREPLWFHMGTSYDTAATSRLAARLRDGEFDVVFCTIARTEWPADIEQALGQKYTRENAGSVVFVWEPKAPDAPDLSDGFDTLARLGGNVVGAVLHSDRYHFKYRRSADGTVVMGTPRKTGQVMLNTPTYRVSGIAVIDRLPGTGDEPLASLAKITVHGSSPEEVLWSERLVLAPGEQTRRVAFTVDPGARSVMFWIDNGYTGQERKVFAGYRELEIQAAVEGPVAAPVLRPGVQPARLADREEVSALFGDQDWRPETLLLREAQPGAAGVGLTLGGEIWFHTPNMTGLVEGRIRKVPGPQDGPMVRVVWYKGGRLQLMQNGVVPDAGNYAFRVWTAEPGGWIGILTDPGENAAVEVEVTHSTLQP